jgi:tetratricopeptide (TPR) repeat protein
MGVIKKHRPHVFVVMAFGRREVRAASDKAPAVEVDFDQVYRLLLAPALKQAGCEPFRADEEPGAGDIRTDMFFELATADFVLADISILNPNVFYELGVRQGVAERGVIMVHGGHSKRPFDIAPDRTFGYDGNLFVHPIADPAAPALAAAVTALAGQIRNVVLNDPIKQSSPVYKELPGLKPPDVRDIRSATARYFDAAFDEIAKRVKIAKKLGLVGDILTLADEAPNRLYRARLLGIAGKSLIDLQHFELALELLRETIELTPDDIDSQSFIGLALNRIGRTAEAEVSIQDLVKRAANHNDGQGALGRVYKDQWRSRWEALATPEERCKVAGTFRAIAEKSIESYAGALKRDQRSYYNGINAVGMARLLEHLKRPSSFAGVEAATQLVRIVAEQTVELTKGSLNDNAAAEQIWALATCGELALLRGDAEETRKLFEGASTDPGVTLFQLESMLRQIEMYEKLGYRPEAVQAAREAVEAGRAGLPKALAQRRNVIFASGHMIDAPGRPVPRFPPAKEAAVAAQIAECLADWDVGPEDLLICGAARGADLLVAEAALKRGAGVALYLARGEGEYLVESVDLPNSRWRERYFAAKQNPLARLRFQPDELGTPPASVNVHVRNNRWCMNTAWATARKREHVFVLLVWDGQPTGDGPGGTSHAAELAQEYAGKLAIINPTPP